MGAVVAAARAAYGARRTGPLVGRTCAVIGWCGAGWRRGEISRLPEQHHLFEPAEDAGEAGHDQGVQCGRQPELGLVRLESGAEADDMVGQRGRVN